MSKPREQVRLPPPVGRTILSALNISHSAEHGGRALHRVNVMNAGEDTPSGERGNWQDGLFETLLCFQKQYMCGSFGSEAQLEFALITVQSRASSDVFFTLYFLHLTESTDE